LELGGQIGVTSGVNVPHNNPPADTDGGGVFFFSPRVGYFVIDQLELVTEFDFQVGFGVRNPSDLPVDGANVGFGAGMQYIFDFHVICLYLGGLVGASFYVPYGAGPTVPYFRVRIPVGIMFPFNHHVALNAGLETQIDVHLGDDPGYTTIYFPIGYFGIRGFFNLCRKQN
jgi:hypothetical protein